MLLVFIRNRHRRNQNERRLQCHRGTGAGRIFFYLFLKLSIILLDISKRGSVESGVQKDKSVVFKPEVLFLKEASGGLQQLGAQVKMVDAANSLIWAEQFVYTSKFTSNRLENVWWLPFENSDTSVAVSNTTAGAVTVTLTVDGTSPHQSQPTQITLNPWQTRVLDIMDDIVNHNGHIHDTGGISITHNGVPGAVLARMFISKPNKGYSAAVNFIDPASPVSQKWNGNGLRFKNFNGADLDQVLVARNNGSQTSHVQGRVIYTAPNGTVQTINIPQFSISGGSTRLVDLDNLLNNIPNSVGYGGIELDYDTPKGTIATSVQSVSQDGNHVFQVPMFDPQTIPSGAAGFPWKADGDFRTIVYIKNESDSVQKFVTHLVWDGGQYSDGGRDIKPHQTIAVDFRLHRQVLTIVRLARLKPRVRFHIPHRHLGIISKLICL